MGMNKPSISEMFEVASRNEQAKGFRPYKGEQEELVDLIRGNLITFALGAAGTGKTHCVIGTAVEALKRGEVDKIVIVRPAVNAEEDYGYSKGWDEEKLSGYMQPVLDEFCKIIGAKKTADFLDNGTIKVIPVAKMRGRTLNDAFVVIDEAQNNTIGQTEMLISRVGKNSRLVICGDAKQNDLEKVGKISGLMDAVERFTPFKGEGRVAVKTLKNVMRGPIAELAVQAYSEKSKATPTTPKPKS